jgi:hypothetical protein
MAREVMVTQQEIRADGAWWGRCRWRRTAVRASRVGRQCGRVFSDNRATRGATASCERSARCNGRCAMANRWEAIGREGDEGLQHERHKRDDVEGCPIVVFIATTVLTTGMPSPNDD